MTQKVSPKEKLILQVVEKLPFSEEDKKAWEETIQKSGANEELVKDILEKSSHLTAGEEGDALALARNTAELARQIHNWRLEQNLGNLNTRGHRHHR